MSRVEADLTIVPIVGMAGRAQHTRRNRSGNFLIVASQKKGIRPPSHLFRFFDEQEYRMLFRSGDKKTESVKQTADANLHGLRGNILHRDGLNKLSGSGRGFQAIRYNRKWILVWHGNLTPSKIAVLD